MNMARAAAKLFTDNLRYSDGTPVEVVIADTTIGRVPEAAACADKFKRENVAVTLTVTPCWCYGSETMDMDRMTIKGVWGFNGTERPGAVYLASVLATHAQKGLPAFGIYGHDVQNADDTEIPEDVKEKILRFGRSAIAREKKNLFGHAAYDDSPSQSASGYKSVRESILAHAEKYLQNSYLNPLSDLYHGGFFGDKAGGMNVRYASEDRKSVV